MNEGNKELAVLRVMGCESKHYGSMEKYLESLALECNRNNIRLFIVYENIPESLEFISNATNNGATFIRLKMNKKLDISFLYNLYRIIKTNRIDIIHSYFSPTCHYTAFIGKIAGVKTVKTAGNMPLQSHLASKTTLSKSLRLKVSIKQLIPTLFLDRLICISEAVKNEFRSFGINAKKIKVINLGINVNIFNPDHIANEYIYKEFGLNRQNQVVGTVGRFEKQKNLFFLLDVIKIVAKKNSQIRLILVGDGSLREGLENRVKELNIEENVIFAGRRNDVEAFLKTMSIFVFPSLFEGMGNALLEAMAMKKACIVSDLDVFKEIVIDDFNGIICQQNNVECFARSILNLLSEPEKLERIGENAYKTIKEKFSINTRVDRTISFYKELFKED